MAIDPSTGAGLACTRALLGLTGPQLADMLGVAERTIRRWEAGQDRIPAGAVSDLYRLQTEAARMASEIAGQVKRGATVVTVYRSDDDYHEAGGTMPAAWHRAVVARAGATADITPVYAGDPIVLSADMLPVEQWAQTARGTHDLATDDGGVMSQMPGPEVTALSRQQYVLYPGGSVWEIVQTTGQSASHPLELRRVPGDRYHSVPGAGARPTMTLWSHGPVPHGGGRIVPPGGLLLLHQGARYRIVVARDPVDTGGAVRGLRLRADGWVSDDDSR